MPAIALAIPPAMEAIAAGLTALRVAMAANRVRRTVQAAQIARAAQLEAQLKAEADAKAKEKEQAVPKTDSTTVVGKKTLNCGEDGSYGDLQKKTGDNKFDRDHIPSKAALQQAARDLIDKARIKLNDAAEDILFGDNGTISKAGQTIVTPKNDHKNHSRTYGSNNTPQQISDDAEDLQKAAEKDTKAMEDGLEGKENDGKGMDPECLEKYKKAAEKIRQKTHGEYLNDLKALIKDAIDKTKGL